jgi:hypothetical protein
MGPAIGDRKVSITCAIESDVRFRQVSTRATAILPIET